MNHSLSEKIFVFTHRVKTLTCCSLISTVLIACGGSSGGDSDVPVDDVLIPGTTPTPAPTGITPPAPSPVATPISSPVVVPTPVASPAPVPSPIEVVKVFYAINVGGEASVDINSGLSYTQDQLFNGGDSASTNTDIQGASVQNIYQTERWGNFSYNLPVDNGRYDITLQFAEFYWNEPGRRIMHVDIEGNRAIADLDIVAEVGANRMMDRVVEDVSVSDGMLNLQFSARQDYAKLSGIVVEGTEVVLIETPLPTVAPVPTQTPAPIPTFLPTPVVTPPPGITPTPVASPIPSPIIVPTPVTSPLPTPIGEPGLDGAQLYQEYGCTACHGNDGQQVSQPIVFDNYSYETFLAKIEDTMPPASPSSCVGDCAEAVATYAWSLRPQVSCDSEAVLPRRVRLLTKFEYINTVNDLFERGDAESLASGIGSDTVVKGFDNNAEANRVSTAQMDAYWTAAQAIASSSNVSPWLSTANCGQNNIGSCFAEKFGSEAFRRDLTNDEIAEYGDLFSEGANDEEGARIVVQTMLVSPNFLYRTELGQNGQLTQYEIANLLSYTFWGSMPDQTLFDKARSNALSSTEDLAQEVERLVADAKANQQFVHFGRQWLDLESVANLDRDDQLFPEFDEEVAAAMDAEVDLFLAEVMLQDGYGMADVFQSDFVFANEALADFYGLDSVSGSAMQRVSSDDARGGVLSLGALLARNAKFDESHPIKRGLIVRENLLCQEFGTPPPVIGEVEPFDPDKPTRERFAAHTANEACASCHQFIDEIGFAFENYDAVGKFRATESNGVFVDATGSISGLERMTDPDVHAFSNLQDLSAVLATEGLHSTSECLVETFQRMMEGVEDPDSCTATNIASRWASGSIKDLWIEMIASQSFTLRQ